MWDAVIPHIPAPLTGARREVVVSGAALFAALSGEAGQAGALAGGAAGRGGAAVHVT